MNYFSKNLKHIRSTQKLTQEGFAKLFGLSKQNINSYENFGKLPRLDKYFEITAHFSIHPTRFFFLDMTTHNVYENHSKPLDQEMSESNSIKIDNWLGVHVGDERLLKTLDDLEPAELRKQLVKQNNVIRELLKENMEVKDLFISQFKGNEAKE